ncbi:unnamed protein product [Chrysoparadoxa australica]
MVLLLPAEGLDYDSRVKEWMRYWALVDHCLHWDAIWLKLVSRAVKRTSSSYNWCDHLEQIYTHTRLAFNTPMGQGSRPAMRQIPPPFRNFAGKICGSHAYLRRLAKLLVFLLGQGQRSVSASDVVGEKGKIEEPTYLSAHLEATERAAKRRRETKLSKGTVMLLELLRSLRPYFHPSNYGEWSMQLGGFLSWFVNYLGKRLAKEQVQAEAGKKNVAAPEFLDEVVVIMEAILPLCHELLYSKHSTVMSYGESCIKNIAAVAPRLVARFSLPVLSQALDPVAAVNHTHQAGPAMRALSLLIHPLLHPRPYLAPFLPQLLQWTLPGLDPNDLNKTVATLDLYLTIAMWVPISGTGGSTGLNGDASAPPPLSCLDNRVVTPAVDAQDLEAGAEAIAMLRDNGMLEWAMSALERILLVIQHRGKLAKGNTKGCIDTMNTIGSMSGLGGENGGGMPDVMSIVSTRKDQALSLTISYFVKQLLAQMDDAAFALGTRLLLTFCLENTLPDAAKDAAALLDGCTRANPQASMTIFFGPLRAGLTEASEPTLVWRLRLLSGLVKRAGPSIVQEAAGLEHCISLGLLHRSKRVVKTACKLLRHTLHALCEVYPIDTSPSDLTRSVLAVLSSYRILCSSPNAMNLGVAWHEPSEGGELDLARSLVRSYIVKGMEELQASDAGTAPLSLDAKRVKLRVIHYALRGCISVVDGEAAAPSLLRNVNHFYFVLLAEGLRVGATRDLIAGLRAKILSFVHTSCAAISGDAGQKSVDEKSVKILMAIARLAMIRRSAIGHRATQYAVPFNYIVGYAIEISIKQPENAPFPCYLELIAGALNASLPSQHDAPSSPLLSAARGLPLAQAVARQSCASWSKVCVCCITTHFTARDSSSAITGGNCYSPTAMSTATSWSFRATALLQVRSPAALIRPSRALRAVLLILAFDYISATVRAVAQKGAEAAALYYGSLFHDALPHLITCISNPGAKGPQAGSTAPRVPTGAAYLLHKMRAMRRITASWPLTSAFLLALCRSSAMLASLPPDRQGRMAARLQILFARYISSYENTPVVTDADRQAHSELVNGLLGLLQGSRASGPEAMHWRYRLMNAWCLLHLIRVDSRQVVVWQWFISGFSNSAELPLQVLSLNRFVSMLALLTFCLTCYLSPGAGIYQTADVVAMLTAQPFLSALVSTAALYHKDAGDNRGPENWSLGVEEVLSDGVRESKHPRNRNRLGRLSQMLSTQNVMLLSYLARTTGIGIVAPLLAALEAGLSGAPEEDKTLFQCTAAECCSGIIRGITKAHPSQVAAMWSVLLPFVEKQMANASAELSKDWADAIKLCYLDVEPAAVDPLTQLLAGKAAEVLRDAGSRDDFTEQAKWLLLVQPVMIQFATSEAAEAGACAKDLAIQLTPLLLGALAHPFKTCRVQIARCLYLVTSYLEMDPEWTADVLNTIKAQVSESVAVLQVEAADEAFAAISKLAVDPGDPADPTLPTAHLPTDDLSLSCCYAVSTSRMTQKCQCQWMRMMEQCLEQRETVLHLLFTAVSGGDISTYSPSLLALLPVIFDSTLDPHMELAAIAKHTCFTISQVRMTARFHSCHPFIQHKLTQFMQAIYTTNPMQRHWQLCHHPGWQLRLVAMSCTTVFQTQHQFLLSAEENRQLDETMTKHLSDGRREVQERARLAFTTRIARLNAVDVNAVCSGFVTMSKGVMSKLRKRRRLARTSGKPQAVDAQLQKEQQTVCLGLAGVALAEPYDVSPWTPEALVELARHQDASGVKETVSYTFKEFRRTHLDNWVPASLHSNAYPHLPSTHHWSSTLGTVSYLQQPSSMPCLLLLHSCPLASLVMSFIPLFFLAPFTLAGSAP